MRHISRSRRVRQVHPRRTSRPKGRCAMARIQGVPQKQASPMVKLVYKFMRRGMKKLTGREPARGSGIEPVEIWAYQPKMLSGMGKFQQAVRKGEMVDERVKYLVEIKGSQ